MIHALIIDGKPTNITVKPDPTWPNMWRIHQGDRTSDMVNLTRAKDAALSWAGTDRKGGIRRNARWDMLVGRS